MLEHLTDEQIASYRKRDLKPDELLAASKHCLSCEQCRNRLNESGKLQAAFKNLHRNLQTAARASPEHLAYEMLEAYVDNRADELDREIVESHLELCGDCANEIRELQEFAALMQAPADKEDRPAEKVTLRQRLLSLIGLRKTAMETSGAFAGLRLAGLALVLLASAASVFMIYKVLNSEPGPIARGNENLPPANQNLNANQAVPENPVIAYGNQNEANKNSPRPQPQPTSVLAFLVPLEISRGGGDERSTLRISPEVGFVDLKVEVQNSDGKSFTAQLQKIGGPVRNLKAGSARNGAVSFRVAVSALSNGQYYMKIFRLPRDPDDSGIETLFKVEKGQP